VKGHRDPWTGRASDNGRGYTILKVFSVCERGNANKWRTDFDGRTAVVGARKTSAAEPNHYKRTHSRNHADLFIYLFSPQCSIRVAMSSNGRSAVQVPSNRSRTAVESKSIRVVVCNDRTGLIPFQPLGELRDRRRY